MSKRHPTRNENGPDPGPRRAGGPPEAEEARESRSEVTPAEAEEEREGMEEEMERLRRELEEIEARYKRALADYANFQRRAKLNESEARQAGVRAVLESLIPALDSFEMALSQDLSAAEDVESVLSGVRAIRQGLLDALADHGVTIIRPGAGDPFDPSRHEAVAHTPAEGIESGRIAAPLQVGFAIGERVVRPAKVAVVPSEED